MLKKILAAFIICAFCFSMVPKEAFCCGHQQDMEANHQHCSVTCHTCFNVVLMPAQTSFAALEFASTFYSAEALSYQNPVITRLKRPPIQIS